jgi:hypothetical protein
MEIRAATPASAARMLARVVVIAVILAASRVARAASLAPGSTVGGYSAGAITNATTARPSTIISTTASAIRTGFFSQAAPSGPRRRTARRRGPPEDRPEKPTMTIVSDPLDAPLAKRPRSPGVRSADVGKRSISDAWCAGPRHARPGAGSGVGRCVGKSVCGPAELRPASREGIAGLRGRTDQRGRWDTTRSMRVSLG